MEELTQQFPETIPFANSLYHSLIYQPDKVSLNSYDTIVEPDTVFTSSSFTIRLQKPALNVKSVELLRASFPTPVTNISDQCCTFWYYKYPPSSTLPTYVSDLNPSYLFCVRLQPSWTPPELVGTQYAYNRTFTDYNDLVSELNKAAANDPFSDTIQFIANDITFSYNATYNKIVMTGNSGTSSYCIAGQQDKNVAAAVAQLQINTSYPGSIYGYAGRGQPYSSSGLSLAQKLGWSWNGASATDRIDFANQFRPTLSYIGLGSPISTRINIANNYANLVNTACVYVYVDWVAGSSQDSQGNGGLLGAIPLNTGNNSVGFFDKVISNPLSKIPPQLQEIRVLLKDENGNPFNLPLTAQVNLELGFSYL